MRNGYNAVSSRSVLLRRLADVPVLAHWVPFLHALSAGGGDLLVGQLAVRLFEWHARADSSEGTQQGLPPSSPAFCIAIQPELADLDAELAAAGGCARAIMDDVYAVGPAEVVFPAVTRFATALRLLTSPEIQSGKSACWSLAYDLEACPYREAAGIPLGWRTVGGEGSGGCGSARDLYVGRDEGGRSHAPIVLPSRVIGLPPGVIAQPMTLGGRLAADWTLAQVSNAAKRRIACTSGARSPSHSVSTAGCPLESSSVCHHLSHCGSARVCAARGHAHTRSFT